MGALGLGRSNDTNKEKLKNEGKQEKCIGTPPYGRRIPTLKAD